MSAAPWSGRKVLINVGTGGVGKTSVSAAMAIAAAASGRRTLVMTIDPARRLANALGLQDLGNVEREITAEQLAPYGVKLQAPLWAMMPDVKRTFDELVERFAPSEERRQAILKNRIYQHFSTVLAGSLEYAAVEKLHEVYTSGRYDLVVLDTPPSSNAVDFLGAPSRIIDFLEQETVQWLLKPYSFAGRFSLKMLDLGSSFILKTLGRLAGADTLRELAEFVMGFQGMYEGFRARSQLVKELLASEDVAFSLVTTTQPTQHAAMFRFKDELAAEGLLVRAVVVNRVRTALRAGEPGSDGWASVAAALAPLGGEALTKLEHAFREEQELARADAREVALLRDELAGVPILTLPELPTDVRDLAGLARLQAHFSTSGDATAP